MNKMEHLEHQEQVNQGLKHTMPGDNRFAYFVLAIIFLALLAVSQLRVWLNGPFSSYFFMQTFMGFFFLTFGALKALNGKEFSEIYRTYDIVAAKSKYYAYAYPVIELGLGVALLYQFHPITMNAVVLVLMVVGSIGVAKNLLADNSVPCACLGNIIKLPLSKISLTEDILMGAMALHALMQLT